MKKVFTFAILVALSLGAFSQTYKPFKVDVGGLYALPSGDDYKAGAGFYLEPKYNITDNLSAGLKMEWAVIGASDIAGMDVSISAIGTYQLTADYYFGTNKVRPFVGAGAGIYTLGTAEVSSAETSFSEDVDFGNKFGFSPRAGLLLGHFRLGLEYNVITGIEDGMQSKNYLALKVGFEIGGGKK